MAHQKKSGAKKRARKPERKKARAAKSGTPFEIRATHALGFVNPTLRAEHDVQLLAKYGRPRQFDVGLSANASLSQLYEAKDYGSKVPIEKVEAFETKVAELQVPPVDGAGMVSSHGFQEGPIARARFFGDSVRVRRLYQLREVEEDDWNDRVKAIELAFRARQLSATDVRITLAKGETLEDASAPMRTDRNSAFLYDRDGRIKGNLLDDVNDRLRALPALASKDDIDSHPPISIAFDDATYMRFGNQLARAISVEFTPAHERVNSTISLDFGTGARDTLVDCLSDRRWIIPDPDRAISASRSGFDVKMTYEQTGTASLDALALSEHEANASNAPSTAQLVNALQTQLLLRLLAGEDRDRPRSAEDRALVARLDEATRLLVSGDHESAKTIYWETCGKATSLVALVNLACIYERARDFDQALRLTLRAIELFPLEVESFDSCIAVCIGSERFEDAERLVKAAHVLHAGNPVLVRREAQLHFQRRRWAEAATAFAHLRVIDPKDAKARLSLAICESELGNDEAAAWDALAAFRLGLENLDLECHVVQLLNRAKAFREALDAGCAAIARARDPRSSAAQHLRLHTAIAAYESNEHERAATLAEGLTITSPLLDFLGGLLAYAKQDFSGAYASFKKYVQAVPESAAASGGARNLSLAATGAGLHAEAYAAIAGAETADASEDYWTIRCIAGARVGNHEDAIRSAVSAASRGVDAAALLIAASNAATKEGHHPTSAQLRLASLGHSTEHAPTLLEQAILRVELVLFGQHQGSHDEVERLIERAVERGANPKTATSLRLLLAIQTGDATKLTALAEAALGLELEGYWVMRIAAEAEIRGRSGLALDFLNRFDPKPLPAGLARFPHPASLRASALLNLGQSLDDVVRALKQLADVDAHPHHAIVTAYWCYATGELRTAIAQLDRAGALLGSGTSVELPLRLQCLVELGQCHAAAELMRAHQFTPDVSWLERGDYAPEAVQSLIAANPMVADAITRARSLNVEAEHITLMLRHGKVLPAIMPTTDWVATFAHAARIDPECMPVLVRFSATAPRTARRLRRPRS